MLSPFVTVPTPFIFWRNISKDAYETGVFLDLAEGLVRYLVLARVKIFSFITVANRTVPYSSVAHDSLFVLFGDL
jgi:hypothetical protein